MHNILGWFVVTGVTIGIITGAVLVGAIVVQEARTYSKYWK